MSVSLTTASPRPFQADRQLLPFVLVVVAAAAVAVVVWVAN